MLASRGRAPPAMPLPSATYLCGSESHLSRVGCVLWYLFFPFILVYHSVRIYVVPCFASCKCSRSL